MDPDDKTPLAIRNTGADIVSYGAPVLPGAMFLLAYYQVKDGENPRTVAIMGLPGCVMYAKRTIFDLVLPRIMADDQVTADDLAALGQGGLCLLGERTVTGGFLRMAGARTHSGGGSSFLGSGNIEDGGGRMHQSMSPRCSERRKSFRIST